MEISITNLLTYSKYFKSFFSSHTISNAQFALGLFHTHQVFLTYSGKTLIFLFQSGQSQQNLPQQLLYQLSIERNLSPIQVLSFRPRVCIYFMNLIFFQRYSPLLLCYFLQVSPISRIFCFSNIQLLSRITGMLSHPFPHALSDHREASKDFSLKFSLQFFNAKETWPSSNYHKLSFINQQHIRRDNFLRNLAIIWKRWELYKIKGTQFAIKFITGQSQRFDLVFEFIHIYIGSTDQFREFMNIGSNSGIYNFLYQIIFTPERQLKLSLYLFIISVVVGLGHFQKDELKSFSADRSKAWNSSELYKQGNFVIFLTKSLRNLCLLLLIQSSIIEMDLSGMEGIRHPGKRLMSAALILQNQLNLLYTSIAPFLSEPII